ncbi:hypothetical protein NUW54_g5423 [Trametes sanguinea]|uniref:Uncharacterized protein n=1 Tax=Trametes sanguinea TaxID=158606 RepID=A0ACC1PY52_9APHY|nr:hypothetical protein NUW54_g5423 [Trametes sanguinea]
MSHQRNGEFLPLKHEIVLGNPTTYTTTYVAIWATGSREPATEPISGLSSAASTIGEQEPRYWIRYTYNLLQPVISRGNQTRRPGGCITPQALKVYPDRSVQAWVWSAQSTDAPGAILHGQATGMIPRGYDGHESVGEQAASLDRAAVPAANDTTVRTDRCAPIQTAFSLEQEDLPVAKSAFTAIRRPLSAGDRVRKTREQLVSEGFRLIQWDGM